MLADLMRSASLEISPLLRSLKRNVLSVKARDEWCWERFHAEVRSTGRPLLARLPGFPRSILVAGCQRSGTTALARLVTLSDGMVDYRTSVDDELDAALILSGVRPHTPRGRYCFQTTYLNERYVEYFHAPGDCKLIWVLRNPFSVVFSMKYNWQSFAFNELFDACGAPLLGDSALPQAAGGGGRLSRTRKACLSYVGKQRQALELAAGLGERMLVVDYDDLVLATDVLPEVLRWAGLAYRPRYSGALHGNSVNNANSLTGGDRKLIEESCLPVYREVRELAIRS